MNAVPFTLRQLEVFLAVAADEHVTRAAERLHLTQSAVSTALQGLESELRGPLFDRVGRQVRLNARGREFRASATGLLERARDIVLDMRSEDGELSGYLRVGASSTIGVYLLPRIIGQFARRYPNVDVELEVGNTEQIERQVADNRLDLAFIEGPAHRDKMLTEPLLADELIVFCSKEHPLAGAGKLGKREARREDWIMREMGSGSREVLDNALKLENVTVQPYLVFGHTEAVKQAVQAGIGIGCLSRLAIATGLDLGLFVTLRANWLDLRRTLWILSRPGAYGGGIRGAFLEHLREHVRPVRTSADS
jgi:DNA-binding transcriptional LysR family regulator